MSIKDACRPRVRVTVKLSKEGCITLTMRGRPYYVACKYDWSKCGPPSIWETYSSKMGLSKIRNLAHKYGTTNAQFPIKTDGAQSSIIRSPIPLKDINSWTWRLIKGPWKDSHDLRPIMFTHTWITLLSKPTKRDMKEGKWSIVHVK
jgi:hypothetical protein